VIPPAILASGGAMFAFGAPTILAANGHARGARLSALYRALIRRRRGPRR